MSPSPTLDPIWSIPFRDFIAIWYSFNIYVISLDKDDKKRGDAESLLVLFLIICRNILGLLNVLVMTPIYHSGS